LIYSVQIILNSGVMIFNKSFTHEGTENGAREFLVSGLFTALSQLVHETLDDELKELILQNRKIFFTFRDSYFIVLVASYETDSEIAKKIIAEIDEEFAKIFNLDEFQGRIDIFHDFKPIVDEIIEKNKTEDMRLLDKYENIIKSDVNKISKIKGDLS